MAILFCALVTGLFALTKDLLTIYMNGPNDIANILTTINASFNKFHILILNILTPMILDIPECCIKK